MNLSLSAAARMTGKAKSTIHRAIKTGRLSAQRHDDGTYTIDAAELSRAFPEEVAETVQRDAAPPPPEPLATEVAVLRTKVEMLTALLDREREATADLRQALAMLPRSAPSGSEGTSTPPGRSFLARLLGR